MEEEDKQLYLRFVNGRSKMPTDMSQIRYKHLISHLGGGDNQLPRAHVCYFQIDLPNYSTKEILK